MTNRRRRNPRLSPPPAWVVVLGVLALVYLLMPLVLMGTRVSWGSLGAILGSDEARDALQLSLRTCVVALGVDIILGVPAALLLSRDWRGVRIARVLVALPLSLPPVVAGIALLAAFGRRSPLGALLESLGLEIAFSTTAVIFAQVFVSLPFLVVTLESALRTRPEGMEEMAATLGAGPSRILWSITLPMVAPAIGRGSALALARCLGEFGATLTFAGSLQGVTRTLPLQIYLARESDSDLALALGAVLLVVAACVVALTEIPGRRRLVASDEEESAVDPSPVDAPPRSEPSPRVNVNGRIAARDWAVDIVLPAGRVSAVVGPNGSGKSTLAHVIAGLLPLDEGVVEVGGRAVDSADSFVRAKDRRIALVSQTPRIFPHMSVLDNVAFPLRCRGASRAEARRAAMLELTAVGCAALAQRRGDELSGGQAAKVGLARALSGSPDVLILDEPTAALDVEAAARVSRVLLRMVHREAVTTLLITHDVVEALQLADRVVVLEDGVVVEEGPAAEVLTRPTSVFGARLAGLNIVTGEATVLEGELVSVPLGEGRLFAAPVGEDGERLEIEDGQTISLLFPPEAVVLSVARPTGSPRSVLKGVVQGVDEAGGIVTVGLVFGEEARVRARVTTAAWAELNAAAGETLWCSIKATQIRVIRRV